MNKVSLSLSLGAQLRLRRRLYRAKSGYQKNCGDEQEKYGTRIGVPAVNGTN
jgi:hypothetical protein